MGLKVIKILSLIFIAYASFFTLTVIGVYVLDQAIQNTDVSFPD
jgi:hypothetical protein